MPTIKKFLRRVLGVGTPDFEFHALKSHSAHELASYGTRRNIVRSHSSGRAESRGRRSHLTPSYYSHHDDLALMKPPDSNLKIENHNKMDDSKAPPMQIAFIHVESSGFGDRSNLSHIPEEQGNDKDSSSEEESRKRLICDNNNLLNSCLATCHMLRQQEDFAEGILLKAIDYKCAYDELYSILRNSGTLETRLPSNRFTGFIVISYKLLPGTQSRKSLDDSWLNWSGAREIYKYCPREWNLKRITLHCCHQISQRVSAPGASSSHSSQYKKSSKDSPFQYVLLCEFSNLLNPKHFLDGCETVERLKTRRCGLVGLYRVQWVYERPQKALKDFEVDKITSNEDTRGKEAADCQSKSEIRRNSTKSNAKLTSNGSQITITTEVDVISEKIATVGESSKSEKE